MECLQRTDAERLVQTLDQEIRSRGRGSIRASNWWVPPSSIGWLMILLDEAECAIYAGIEIAQERGDRAVIKALLQRLSYVVADRGEHAEALRLAEVAAIGFLRVGDLVGMAKTLVDQGIWLSRLHQATAAIEAMKSALEWLPRGEQRNRFTAFQVLGLNYRRLREFELALDYLIEAEKLALGVESLLRGKATWLKGKLHADLGQLNRAESHLADAVETFRPLHVGETALVTCELVRIQLLQGRPADAYRSAISMRALLEPLRHNEIISAAICDLLRSGQAGMTLALVECVRSRIKSERKDQRTWGALRATHKSS